MRLMLLSSLLIFATTTPSVAVPVSSLEHGTVPQRTYGPAEDGFTLKYYNYCSEWLFYWWGYCYGLYEDAPLPPMYGTCFDLSDCPGNCRHLEDVWWACKYYHYRGWASIEVYCADESCCPTAHRWRACTTTTRGSRLGNMYTLAEYHSASVTKVLPTSSLS
jgi:hypothetical protein